MAGKKPKPTNLKILEGTYRPDRAPKNEARPQGEATPPGWLTDGARAIWADFVPSLLVVGLATDADTLPLARYCETFASYLVLVEDARQLDRQRYHTTKTETVRAHPVYAELRRIGAELLAIEIQFGMTPSARTRVEAAPTGGELDEWQKRARRAR